MGCMVGKIAIEKYYVQLTTFREIFLVLDDTRALTSV
jgi:hypothetical protein